MQQLDLELAAEELLACEAMVTHTQVVQKIEIDNEKEWHMRLHKFERDNEKDVQHEDNPQEASSFHVMPNLYLRVVVS